MKTRIFSFNLTGDRLAALKAVGKKLRVEIIPCEPAQQQLPVFALGFPDQKTALSPLFMPFADELLLLSGLSDTQIDLFLGEWKKAGCAPVRLKAVVTPTNSLWTVRQLYTQLRAEADEMKA